MRSAKPISEKEARHLYPAHFADWSPRGDKEGARRIVTGDAFLPLDPLALRDALPVGTLEQSLSAVRAGEKTGESFISLLRTSRLQIPSTTMPARDGSGMTPLALDRPPIVWILVFTRLELAQRFADNARFCLELSGDDLLARLPTGFGLHFNYGAASSCRLGSEDIPHD